MLLETQQPQAPQLTCLKLLNFRCFEARQFDFGHKHIFISGENGVGKTALLEALSLFSPGRGLRQARLSEMQSATTTAPWCVNLDLTSSFGHHFQLATAFEQKGEIEKRIIKSNQTVIKQNELQELATFIWLTPQMERQFHDSNSARRKFIDRLIAQLDPSHMGRIGRYEKLMSQRRHLLQQGKYDPLWVEILEHDLSKTAVSIVAIRMDFIEQLQKYCTALDSDFPEIRIHLKGQLETALMQQSALEVENLMIQTLKQSRNIAQDITPIGAHKVEIELTHASQNIPYRRCSTGQQKAIFIRLLLGQIGFLRHENDCQPIVLLDDVNAHLDSKKLTQLVEELDQSSSQIFYTATAFPTVKLEDMQHITL